MASTEHDSKTQAVADILTARTLFTWGLVDELHTIADVLAQADRPAIERQLRGIADEVAGYLAPRGTPNGGAPR